MRAAYGHPPQVEFRIVDTTGNRLGDFRVGEIMHIDLDRFAFRLPFLPGFPVVSHQFVSTEMTGQPRLKNNLLWR